MQLKSYVRFLPKINIHITTVWVDRCVIMVRDIVRVIALLTTSITEDFRMMRKFSLTRSKTTTDSLTEYPKTANTAARTVRLNSH